MVTTEQLEWITTQEDLLDKFSEMDCEESVSVKFPDGREVKVSVKDVDDYVFNKVVGWALEEWELEGRPSRNWREVRSEILQSK